MRVTEMAGSNCRTLQCDGTDDWGFRTLQNGWCVYSAFRQTQHNYASKVTCFGLFTGQNETHTYKKLYNRQYNFQTDLSY